jgi:glycosyltransferase involved in cell wall biosynthesis
MMRVLVICKRQYTGKDLLSDRYGRMFELPVQLAKRGHQVSVVTSSYRRLGPLLLEEHGVRWRSVDTFPHPLKALHIQTEEAEAWKPDLIWASSDALHLIAGQSLAQRLKIPAVLDYYDDYEAFNLTKLPGVRHLLRGACAKAQALSIVSKSLAEILPRRGPVPDTIQVIGNGVPENFASTLSKTGARRNLGLHANATLIGTIGALSSTRGIDDLFNAITELRRHNSNVYLVIAGPRSKSVMRNLPANTVDLGILPYDRVPALMRALDVGVVCNRDSKFGRACHPQKLVEMAASGLPIVAAAVGEAGRLLVEQPENLYCPGNALDLAERINSQIQRQQVPDPGIGLEWSYRGKELAELFETTI